MKNPNILDPMSKHSKIILSVLAFGLVFLFFSIFFAEKGFLDLLRLQENKELLRIDNSKIGLELYDSIDHYKRLAKNDPDLIEQLAREQGMIGKDELVLIPTKPIPQKKSTSDVDVGDSFRLLSDDEFDYLLSFDIVTLKFYEELIESD